MKISLSTQTAIRLAQALQTFDGLNEVRDGKPVKEPYKLQGTVRMAIAKNIARLQEVAMVYQKVRNGLIYANADGGGNQVSDANRAKFEKEDRALLDELHEVDLIQLTEAQLNLDANAIAVSTLAAMVPIIDDTAPPARSKANGKGAHANA